MKVYLEVYGCTANKSDASLVKGILSENDFEIVEDINKAEALIVLTCTVIDTTEQRMISRLKELKKTDKLLVVGGCMASIQSDKVKTIVPNGRLLPPHYSYQIIDVINDKDLVFKDKNKTNFSKSYNDIFAPISISEGCNFSCSYCITSKARGKLKSYPIDEIKTDIYNAIRQGCKEIQITSQDTSSYETENGKNLGDLLTEIGNINETFRTRVGMMNPHTCQNNIDSIINGYRSSKIYKFAHLPVQSGDDLILKKMNRKYNVDDFLNIIEKFRKHFPEITISTDVIVGFPTETENQFENTVNLLKKVKPDITNITRFSARPYTKAKHMIGRIDTKIVKERSKYLTSLCETISNEQNQKHIGKIYNILITEKGKDNTFVGRSENYKSVVLKDNIDIGENISVKITRAESTYLFGSII
jgi:MiaB-like tRNA modifying enzyme